MKIYLAGRGYLILAGVEKRLMAQHPFWNRLMSYFYRDDFYKSGRFVKKRTRLNRRGK